MNLNLELHFNPSCSLLKYQKERRFAILTIKTGHNLPFKRALKISRGCLLPSLICPCSEADFISSVQPFPSTALETGSARYSRHAPRRAPGPALISSRHTEPPRARVGARPPRCPWVRHRAASAAFSPWFCPLTEKAES